MERSLKRIIEAALDEDIGSGDVTTNATVPPEASSTAEIIAKQEAVLAGLDAAQEVFREVDAAVEFSRLVSDGARLAPGMVVARLAGPTRSLLLGERVALNLLQHLSGVATLTAQYVERLRGTGVRILDTRKTLPGLRLLEKQAVRAGGGGNHRFGLFDAILIKDNHITAAGGVARAVAAARAAGHHLLGIEVETRTLDEVREALAAGAAVIMLDNMSLDAMREAVRLINGRARTEASGNVSLATVRAIAETGVDFISAGALTHSAPAADLSMKLRA